MQESTERLINESRRRMGYDYNQIDWFSCKFDVSNNKLIVIPKMIALNMCDVYCDIENICQDSLSVYFDKPLPNRAETVEYDESARELHIDDKIYYVKDYTDVGFFVGDLGCRDDQALANLMKNFGSWLKVNEKSTQI